jgi:hypothetical protein
MAPTVAPVTQPQASAPADQAWVASSATAVNLAFGISVALSLMAEVAALVSDRAPSTPVCSPPLLCSGQALVGLRGRWRSLSRYRLQAPLFPQPAAVIPGVLCGMTVSR